ncbi:Uncharacterized protein SAPIO_CDS5149 [Scedosporium apiospermum]|uniref:Sugar phosphate transporter domain-containing protein n=1 Tax=Pseudallescheria apiosperma TaxID=563466 RepID=A0A084G6V6_PSEDA|nr:Uncharacterized protein SAPIO_CDS5149 [Scedosporium apiospermum]KEZ43068.1 Uncharacterized protein SAPIO_CDS5149 [Scedosporium apiospermum]
MNNKAGLLEPKEEDGPMLPVANPDLDGKYPPKAKPSVPAAVYVVSWISLSSAVILHNKWLLDSLNFRLAALLTQIMARWTTLLDSRHKIKMTPQVYMRAILPIGITFSFSLIGSNRAYLYLSVAFIQMLKATTPVAVLLSGWLLGVSRPNLKVLLNVSIIAFGILLASIGEIDFVPIGVFFQLGAVVFEATRLSMVQKLLTAEFKMDPLLSIYYYSPICAVLNFIVALIWDIPKVTAAEFANVGFFNFAISGMFAFFLNLAAVSLIGKTSAVVLTLCGVLKDILLVTASMIIWGTEVTALQAFGYSISLCGIIYYKLGYDAVKKLFVDAGSSVSSLGASKPLLRRASLVAGVLLIVYLLLRSFRPYSPFDRDTMLTSSS